ncbi:MAG: hypothetical protein KF914_00940 [Rhizobiaceae bacterium]|nr:hypothetical protein [Rhizobiaceae bacterium]
MALQYQDSIESEFLKAEPADSQAGMLAAMRTHASNIQPAPGPRSKGSWILSIRKALNRINQAQTIPGFVKLSESSSSFDTDLVDAVRAYKNHRKILGPGQTKVDTIIGRGTMGQIDFDLKALEGKPDPKPEGPKPLDIVVCITFGGVTAEGEEQGSSSLRARLEGAAHKSKQRDLMVIKFIGSHRPEKNPSVGIADRVVKERLARKGKTCVYGASVGGKNVLQVVGMLTERSIPMSYVGISDGAFFHDDAVAPPGLLSMSAKNLRIKAQTFRSDESVNFYTLIGVKAAPSTQRKGLIWTSDMKGEIHGPVNGFLINNDLTSTIAFGPSTAAAHDQAVFFGDPKHEERIKDILA